MLTGCSECGGNCEKACIHYDFPVRIREIIKLLPEKTESRKADLSIDFCGVKCENPFFLSSSIVAGSYEMCASALKAGWGGIVYKTIGFIVPKEVSPRFSSTEKEGTAFIGFKNLEQISEHPYIENFEALRRLKNEFPTKVIVSSIMGQTDDEWTELARLSEEYGADIVECNFSCPHMSANGLGSDVGENPALVKQYTECVRKGTKLPVLAKMTPNLSHIEIPAAAAKEGGADGIAAINTIKSVTEINLDTLVSYPSVSGKSAVSGYSGKAVKPIALKFITDLAKSEKLSGIPLSGMGGIETWRDAAEFIVAGCSNIQVTTAVMQYGYRIVHDLISGLSDYMISHDINRLEDLVGIALDNIVSADSLDRSTIVYPIFDKNKCVGCGRCYISCKDAGHQAIQFDLEKRAVILNGKKCAGCHLCRLVCPVGAIGEARRINKPLTDNA